MSLDRLTRLLGDGDDLAVWAEAPRAGAGALPDVIQHVLTRERTIRELRHRPGWSVRAVHRLAPARLASGRLADVRAFLLGGVAVELARGMVDVRRPLDDIADAVHGRVAGPLHVGWDGGVHVEIERGDAGAAVLRIGAAGGVTDPRRAASGLRHAARAGLVEIPTALAEGEHDDFAWTVESRLPGERPRRLTRPSIHAVAALTARLPRAGDPPAAWRRDLDTVAAATPSRADRLRDRAVELEHPLAELPAIMRHGDLWLGNVLVEAGCVSGVVDWDNWQPDAVPGTDVLHLVTTEWRLRHRRSLGTAARRRPWLSSSYADATHDLWRRLGVHPRPAVLAAVGRAWWLGQVAADLTRRPELADDDEWMTANVVTVIDEW